MQAAIPCLAVTPMTVSTYPMVLISRPWIEPGPTILIAEAAEIVVDYSRVRLQIELVNSAGSM